MVQRTAQIKYCFIEMEFRLDLSVKLFDSKVNYIKFTKLISSFRKFVVQSKFCEKILYISIHTQNFVILQINGEVF